MSTKLPVVFLHGWGMNANIWRPFFDYADTHHFNYIALDLPGYGEHRHFGDHSISLETMTDFIDELIQTECIILGWSLGGLVATRLAHANPTKYKKLVTVCSSPFFIEEDDWHGMRPDVLRLFADQLVLDHEKLLKRFIALQTMGIENQSAQNKLIMDHVSKHEAPSSEVLKNGLYVLENEDVREHLDEIDVPHLAVFGKLDSLVPQKAISKISTLSDNVKITTMDRAAHAPFLSHPEVFFEILAQFSRDEELKR